MRVIERSRLLPAALAFMLVFSLIAGDALAYQYVVKPGDTLSSIVQRLFGNTKYWADLQLYNGIDNANLIRPGEIIEIPSRAVIRDINKADSLAEKLRIIAVAKQNDGDYPPDPDSAAAEERPARDRKNPRNVNYNTQEFISP